MYLSKEKRNRYVVDIETESLNPQKIWCCVILNKDTRQVHKFINDGSASIYHEIKRFIDEHPQAIYIGHNLLSFDVPVINRLCGTSINLGCCIDSLVLSYLYNPALDGGHSLESYGSRLGLPKIDFHDWSKFSEPMLEYCMTPDHRVLRDDLRWVPCGSLTGEETILGFDEKGPNRSFKKAKILSYKKSIAEVFKVTLASGKVFRTTAEHKWLTAIKGNTCKNHVNLKNWVSTSELKDSKTYGELYSSKVVRYFEPWEEDVSKDAGWLAGIFDGEGSLPKDRISLTVAQNPGPVLERVKSLLSEKYTGSVKEYLHSDCRNLYLGGNKYDILSFLGRIRPERLVLKLDFDLLGRIENRNRLIDHVVSVESAGKQEIIVMSTSTKTLVLDGYLHHNCERDVMLTERVYDALVDRMLKIGFSEQSCEIEHKIRHIIDIQQANGFWFDKPKAIELRDMLRQQETDKAVEIHKLFPPELVEVDTYQYRLKKDGSPFSSYLRHQQEYPVVKHNEDGSYSVYETREFNIGSPKQRVDRLLGLGWKPEVFTPKGFPKVDEDSLNNYAKESGHQAVAAMADWLVSNGRANMLDTWLGYVGEDSRIHGRVFSCGATTRRMRHINPNTANIPSGAKARYGHECRALWGVTPDLDRVLVGYDASGLETVGLLHYLNNPKATEILLRPKPNDVHTANSRLLTEALGREIDREWGAKTTWYAWLYGAYPPKLGSIVKGDKEDGEKIIEVFFKNVPGLQELIEEVRYEFTSNHGLLRTIDGGYVRCPSLNAALNYRIQSMGAIVMKVAAILLHEKLIEKGLWHMKTGDIHDEGQHETDRKSGEELGQVAVQAIKDAGETLNLNVKTGGDYKIGNNWDETH